MKKTIIFIILIFANILVFAQDIPQHISYNRIYDYIDELANEGIFDLNSAVKPYSRLFIANKLVEAKGKTNQLNKRQKDELTFFLN